MRSIDHTGTLTLSSPRTSERRSSGSFVLTLSSVDEDETQISVCSKSGEADVYESLFDVNSNKEEHVDELIPTPLCVMFWKETSIDVFWGGLMDTAMCVIFCKYDMQVLRACVTEITWLCLINVVEDHLESDSNVRTTYGEYLYFLRERVLSAQGTCAQCVEQLQVSSKSSAHKDTVTVIPFKTAVHRILKTVFYIHTSDITHINVLQWKSTVKNMYKDPT